LDGADALADYMSAAQRHWGALQLADHNGVAAWDARDEESGLPHLDHLICSLLMARGIGTLAGLLPSDPGRGNEPRKPRDADELEPRVTLPLGIVLPVDDPAAHAERGHCDLLDGCVLERGHAAKCEPAPIPGEAL